MRARPASASISETGRRERRKHRCAKALALAIPEAPAWPVAGNHRLGCGIGVVASNLNQACHLPEWFRGCAGLVSANAPRRTSGYERYLVVGHQVWRPSKRRFPRNLDVRISDIRLLFCPAGRRLVTGGSGSAGDPGGRALGLLAGAARPELDPGQDGDGHQQPRGEQIGRAHV